jgi:GMP reductase
MRPNEIDYESEKPQLGFRDVMIAPRNSSFVSRERVCLEVNYKFRLGKQSYSGVPLIAANMDTVGTFELAKILGSEHNMMTAIHKHYTEKQWAETLVEDLVDLTEKLWYTMGTSEAEYTKLKRLKNLSINKTYAWIFPKFIMVDVANGYMDQLATTVSRLRRDYGDSIVIAAGNVVDKLGTRQLCAAGVDVVKVGIGSGSACTTRKIAGVGRPQVSAVMECAAEADLYGVKIISDGGCVFPGDISKAFVAGADFVMLGGMLAGHSEIGLPMLAGEHFEFRGMSSTEANKDRKGSLAVHRAAEGKRVLLKARGPLSDTIQQIKGGLRSTGSYINAHLENFAVNGHFYIVHEQTNDVFGKDE